jgi:hypothetical protein
VELATSRERQEEDRKSRVAKESRISSSTSKQDPRTGTLADSSLIDLLPFVESRNQLTHN